MQHRVSVLRTTTERSTSGSTKFVYATIAAGVVCSLQEGGGRMKQAEEGMEPNRAKSALFGQEAMALLKQNDILVLENVNVGQRYRIVHIHLVPDANAPHVEARVEQELAPDQE